MGGRPVVVGPTNPFSPLRYASEVPYAVAVRTWLGWLLLSAAPMPLVLSFFRGGEGEGVGLRACFHGAGFAAWGALVRCEERHRLRHGTMTGYEFSLLCFSWSAWIAFPSAKELW